MKLYWIKSFDIRDEKKHILRCAYVIAKDYGEAENKFKKQINEWCEDLDIRISEIEFLAEEGQYAKPNVIII